VHRDVELLDQLTQQGRATLVDLLRHQPRCELDDVRGHAQQPQRPGRLQAEQAAADDQARASPGCAGGGALCGRPDRVEIAERAVDEAPGQIMARYRRHERRRARGQHERVVGDASTAVGRHRSAGAIDPHRGLGEVQRVALVVVAGVVDQVELVGTDPFEVGRERDPVVGAPWLLGHHRDPPGAVRIALAQRVDQSLADHAVAHDDEVAHLR
jgi:hypothetical protein